jgi:hypothetical protein
MLEGEKMSWFQPLATFCWGSAKPTELFAPTCTRISDPDDLAAADGMVEAAPVAVADATAAAWKAANDLAEFRAWLMENTIPLWHSLVGLDYHR